MPRKAIRRGPTSVSPPAVMLTLAHPASGHKTSEQSVRCAAATAALALAAPVHARSTHLKTPGQFPAAGTGSEAVEMVEQTGEYADQLSSNLENIELPDGFPIGLFAVARDARHMGIVTIVGHAPGRRVGHRPDGLSVRPPTGTRRSR